MHSGDLIFTVAPSENIIFKPIDRSFRNRGNRRFPPISWKSIAMSDFHGMPFRFEAVMVSANVRC